MSWITGSISTASTRAAPNPSVRQVVAGARADDQHVPERLAAARPLQEMDQRVGGAALLERDHRLVADGVDADVAACRAVDLVVGRPARLDRPWDRRRASPERRQGQEGPSARPAQPSALPQQVTHAGAADEEPDHGRCLGKGQGREPGDAREAAADVERVAQDAVRVGVERLPEHSPQPHEEQGHEQEEHGRDQLDRDDELGHVRVVLRAEEDLPR